MEERPRDGEGKLADVLRTQYPVILLAILCVWAYVDLKGDLGEIRRELAPAAGQGGAAEPEQPGAEVPPGGTQPDSLPPNAPPPTPPSPTGGDEASVSWDCQGTIAQDLLLETVGKHGQAVFDCYRNALGTAPDLKGTLILEVNVGASGEVREARVKGPIREPGLLGCVSASVYTWRFSPPPEGGCAVVSIPFMLDPERQDGETTGT